MKPLKTLFVWFGVCLILIAFALTGCAGTLTPKNAPAVFPCVSPDKLEKLIAPEAEMVGFSCSFKKWKGAETLHFKVSVKNISNQPQRFRVHIFLDNGKAVGGLIPRTTKKGLIEPGHVASFVYPVKGMSRQPNAITLKISTVSK